jgi:uncharacterized protein YlxW (UPF0749 family)
MLEFTFILMVALTVASIVWSLMLKKTVNESSIDKRYLLERNSTLTKELMYLEEQLTDSQAKVARLKMIIDSLGEDKG